MIGACRACVLSWIFLCCDILLLKSFGHQEEVYEDIWLHKDEHMPAVGWGTYVFGEYSQNISICRSVPCVMSTLQKEEHSEKLMIYMPSFSLELDAYFYLFFGLVANTFKLCNLHIIVDDFSQYGDTSDSNGGYENRLRKLGRGFDFIDSPNREIEFPGESDLFWRQAKHLKRRLNFMGSDMFHHKYLAIVAIKDSLIDPIGAFNLGNDEKHFMLIHLNEYLLPEDNLESFDGANKDIYSRFRLVFRSDFRQSLHGHAMYLPVRSGKLLTEKFFADHYDSYRYPPPRTLYSDLLSASSRPVLCSFAGGLKYVSKGNKSEPERIMMLEVFRDFQPCILVVNDNALQHQILSESEYVDLIRRSAFVLCPAGLHPETHRPHQAIELGAIPIMLRAQDPNFDYLSQWNGYPGPVFDNWSDAKEFLGAVSTGVMSSSMIDLLQNEVTSWYEEFISSIQHAVKRKVTVAASEILEH